MSKWRARKRDRRDTVPIRYCIEMGWGHKKCTTPCLYNIYKHGRVHDSPKPCNYLLTAIAQVHDRNVEISTFLNLH